MCRLRARERLALPVALAQRHETGHLLLGQPDLLAAGDGEIEILHLEPRPGLGCHERLLHPFMRMQCSEA
jgi:hypothetical protein